MFHRVDEPLDLPAPRFFAMAEWLHVRGGAVTALLATQPVDREVIYQPPAPPALAVTEVDNSAEIAAMAAMSQPGFPGIGYSGG